MPEASKYKLIRLVDSHSIHVLMFSILMLVFLPPFLSDLPNVIDHAIKFDFLLIIIASFLIVRNNKISRSVGLVTFGLMVADSLVNFENLQYLGLIGISYLITHAFSKVLKISMSLKGDTKNMILVSITGYLIIGLIGGFLAAGLEYVIPGSYHHTTGIKLELYNLIYYGFVTMTTLGYGDIIPVTDRSQSLALMLVISGQLFLSIIIAMNIAKFMRQRNL